MKTTLHEVYKTEIQQNLLLAKAQVDKLLSNAENNVSWPILHQNIKIAVLHLRKVTTLLAEQHIAVCVLSKYKRGLSFQSGDVNEVMKAYRYIE